MAVPEALVRWMPLLFVWLWSTGFLGAKYGLPYAEPFTLLAVRMFLVLLVLGGLASWLRSSWPRGAVVGHTAVVGLLIHGCYLGGVFSAIEGGMPAGVTALIVGLQPLVTALAAVAFLGERVQWRQWLGLLLGLGGVALVLAEKLALPAAGGAFPLWTLAWVLLSLVAISLGTVYQKRFCTGVELIPATFIQYCAALGFFVLGALVLEERAIHWEVPLFLALGWLVLGLSVGAILLLMALIRRGAASGVASLFYLVPPVTAFQAWLLFDETFGVQAIVGGLIAVLGVALVVRGRY